MTSIPPPPKIIRRGTMVKRYDPIAYSYGDAEVCEEGKYVLYSDYAKLEALLATLPNAPVLAENGRLKEEVERLKDENEGLLAAADALLMDYFALQGKDG